MKKRLFPVMLVVAVAFLPKAGFSQETLTITTYYPSPVGSYDELGTNKLVVNVSNPTDSANEFNAATMSPGDVHIAGGLVVAAFNAGYDFDQGANPADGQVVTSGNVGIGTTVPSERLSIRGAANNTFMDISDGTEYMHMGMNALGGLISVPSANTDLTFSIGGLAFNNLFLDSGGNVGIGVNNPTDTFQIGNGAGNLPVVRVGLRGNTSNNIDFGTVGVAAPGAGSVGQKIRLWGNGAVAAAQYALGIEGGFMWFTNDQVAVNSGFKWYAGGTTEVFKIQGNGNVGVGSASPGGLLEVLAEAAAARTDLVRIRNLNAGANSNGIWIESGANTTTAFFIRGNSSGSDRFTIASNGYARFGGGGTPGGRLEVVNLEAGSGTQDVTCSLVGGAYRFYQAPVASSRRYKENIEDLKDGFMKILAVTPKSFVYKESGLADIGYIAEDLDDLGLKRLVTYNEAGQPEKIKYDKIALYIIEVMKVQRDAIVRLEKENESLKARVAALEQAPGKK